MNHVRTHYQQIYAPRTISKELLKSLVTTLGEFKSGLPTSSRKIKAQAISPGKITNLEGPESWKVIDPHSLTELEHIHVELLLTSTESKSCELHVEFRSERIYLSVSDIETGWGKSVYEEMHHRLDSLGISSKGIKEKLQRAYFILSILQNIVLAFSVALFAVWLTGHNRTYLYASLGLFIAGSMPAIKGFFNFFLPPKKTALIQETVVKGQGFPLTEAAAIVAFLEGIIQLGKELVALLR